MMATFQALLPSPLSLSLSTSATCVCVCLFILPWPICGDPIEMLPFKAIWPSMHLFSDTPMFLVKARQCSCKLLMYMLLSKDESPFELSWTAKKHKIKMLLLLLPVCVYVCVFVCKCRTLVSVCLRVPFYLRAAALNWIFSWRSKLKWSVKDQRRIMRQWECNHGGFQILISISHLNL